MSSVPELNVKKYVAIVRAWLWLLVAATIIAAGVSYVVSRAIPKSYMSSLSIVVGDDTANLHPNLDDLTVSQRLASVYASMATREPVLSATVAALQLPTTWSDLAQRVAVLRAEGSQLIEIRVTDTDPQRTKATVDEIAHQLILQSPTAENTDELQQRKDFVNQQLQSLQTNITKAETDLADKRAKLNDETSARGVLGLQDQIKALELNLTNWRASYASLLSTNLVKSPNTISVVQPSVVPTSPVSPNITVNVLTGGFLGFLIALGAVLLIEFIRGERLRGIEDVSRMLSQPVLGSVGKIPASSGSGNLVAIHAPQSGLAEDYRRLRTNLQFAWGNTDDPVVVLVTSAGPQEGKSVTSANLAATFARAGKRTILVDTDLLRPSVHRLFGIRNEGGFGALFWGETLAPTFTPSNESSATDLVESMRRRLEALLVQTSLPGLRVLPAGVDATDDAVESPAAEDVHDFLEALRRSADVTILDAAPILGVSDTAALAAHDVGVLLVIEAGQTRIDAARLMLDALAQARARILGVVLNKATSQMPHYQYYRTNRQPTGASRALRLMRR
jgi:capsular exopolysaccharide synthesis family protein